MPGMDGFQVMEALKTNAADGYLPVLVLTAQPGHKLRALQAGAKRFHQQAVRSGRSQDAHPQHAGSAAAVQKLENYNKVLEQTVQERTAELRESEARYRSLTELASDWYWEQDENGNFTKVSGPVLEMLGIRVDALVGEPSGVQVAGWNEAERETLQATIAARQPFLDFAFSRVNADGSQQTFRVSGEPMFNRSARFIGYRGIGVETTAKNRMPDPDGQRCHHPIVRIKTIFSPPCPRRNSSPWLRIWNWSRCRSVKSSTNPADKCSTPISPPPPSCRCTMSWSLAHRPKPRGVGNEGVVGISLFMGGEYHAKLGRGADRRPRLPAGGPLAEAGIQSRRLDAAFVAALHPGADYADDPDRGLQSAPFGGAAAVPLAVADSRSHADE